MHTGFFKCVEMAKSSEIILYFDNPKKNPVNPIRENCNLISEALLGNTIMDIPKLYHVSILYKSTRSNI